MRKIRLEVDVVLEIDVDIDDEQEAEKAAVEIAEWKLYPAGPAVRGETIFEVDDPDVYTAGMGIAVLDNDEVNYEED